MTTTFCACFYRSFGLTSKTSCEHAYQQGHSQARIKDSEYEPIRIYYTVFIHISLIHVVKTRNTVIRCCLDTTAAGLKQSKWQHKSKISSSLPVRCVKKTTQRIQTKNSHRCISFRLFAGQCEHIIAPVRGVSVCWLLTVQDSHCLTR